ncbi:MAG: hypothetical protein M1819_004522 [Sarea resinae]|nr:MAG: hypothetical protein M1819_004522 [Sarea resinae]
MEWGCMQALIDFDGWRKWKDFSEAAAADAARSKSQSPSTSRKAKRSSLARAATPVNLSAGAGTGAGAGSSGVSSPSPSGLQGGGTVMSAAPQTQVAPAQPMLQPSQRVPDMTLTNATSTPGDDSGPPAVAAPVSTVDGTDAGTAPNGVDAAATHAVAPVAAPAAFPDSTIGL